MQQMTHVRVSRGPLHILVGHSDEDWDGLTACGLTLPGGSITESRGYVDSRYGPTRCGDCFSLCVRAVPAYNQILGTSLCLRCGGPPFHTDARVYQLGFDPS